ncbi:MAG: TonB-dependent receptor [Saprospiraceae bacterium]|nr:TonB-dependent receptor [Saprospiraceae bacterium]MCF8250492.1 TonB-dependent receptor [Saprospiraceae bacterium]MCF8281997.1 TonB-dependent receptor [Bacteroidales bacterium]MCF8312362.1 TonB-dependent receptor [Saprospiraceae bacterium]MCF8440641.1 TonB-dependent receptor [Saprospiraceae bacterium]
MNKSLFTLFCTLVCFALHAQDQALLTGTATDALSGQPIELVTVFVKNTNNATETTDKGKWRLEVPANQRIVLVFTRIGYKESSVDVEPLPKGAKQQIDVAMPPADASVEVEVRESRIEQGGMIREKMDELKLLPTTTGNLESMLPHLALGTSSGSGGELTSQYNVRGGNYDENLVYVNDFEIYRPQLIRAGQQEGLTFPNIDLISSLTFSSGGFEARYGDKQSSVLDIHYKRPERFAGSATASLLGGSAHLEGAHQLGKTKYQKLRYLVGARYKTTSYLLGSLDVTGEYNPNFTDVQAYLTYDLSRNWQLGLIGNYNRSEFFFKPDERRTAFGLVNYALELYSVFGGQEVDDFTTSMTGASLTYLPERDKNPLFVKFLASTYRSDENERFDIIGRYSLRQIESGLGSDNYGEVVAELGSGTQHQYVRNFLNANVSNVEIKGGIELQPKSKNQSIETDSESAIRHPPSAIEKSHFLQWSVKYQREDIDDQINEWERLDSAGYSLRYDTTQLLLYSVLKTKNSLGSNRLSAFIQDTYTWRRDSVGEMKASFGVRAAYWDLNDEKFVTPRAQLLYKPLRSNKDISYRFATGLYFQPPFYRELRNLEGVVNRNVQSQKSAHIVGGFTYDFFLGKLSPTKFRLIVEAYYKRLWDVVSYEIDNVRIRYYGQNDASGYITGLDMRLNGEFVPGVESWFNLSLLRARESINNVQHLEREIGSTEGTPVKDVPRPSDQLVTLSVFFQDYLPKHENFKMHLNVFIGTGLPYGLKDNNRIYRNTYRFKPYHRVDIGFSLKIWDEINRASRPKSPFRFTKASWISLEIFNLMQVQNEASRTWIKTIFAQQFAIPNYLTGRRVNLKWRVEF